MLKNQMGQKEAAETLLREAVTAHPALYEAHYSLGLLLAETAQYETAAVHLEIAANGMPEQARIKYNLGLLLKRLERDAEAEAALRAALAIEPDNLDYLFALADFYLKRRQLPKAREIAEEMVARHPNRRIGHDILNHIDKY
jgi:tetratricopeptide (TPR) repeat protein